MQSFILEHLFSAFTFLLTLAFVSAILRARKPAGNTMAWLLVILVAPYVGIPLYIAFGGRKLSLKMEQKRGLYSAKSRQASAAHLHGVQRILSATGVPDPRINESIELLRNGQDAFAKYMSLIENAERSIYITTFIFGDDPVGKALLEALSKKAKEGVDVRVLVDSLGAMMIRLPSLKNFRKAGGRIAYFMPVLHLPFRGRTNLRNHRKLLVTDGRHAILGGMNIGEEYMGPDADPSRWTDLALTIEGPSVRDLEAIFFKDWSFAKRNSDKPRDLVGPHQLPTSGPLAQIVGSGPDVIGDPLYDLLLSSIFSAHHEIIIVTPYFIPDESLAKALELAVKRGIIVKIIMPLKSNHALADFARGSFVRQLQAVGAHIYFYSDMIHAKVVLIDRSVGLLGSANFDMRSLLVNYELGILIYDQEVLSEVRTWIEWCLRKTTREFTKDGFWRQIGEGVGRVVGPLI